MRANYLVFICGLCVGFSVHASAAPRTASPWVIVNIRGAAGLSDTQALTQTQAVINYLATTRQIRLVKFISIQDERPSYNSINSSVTRFNYYYNWARKKRLNRNAHVHFIAPPMVDNGLRWIAGRAIGTCIKNGVSLSNATMVQVDGTSRVGTSTASQAHEMLHILGAKHIDGFFNLCVGCKMLPGYGAYPQVRTTLPPIDAVTRAQVGACKAP